MSLTKHCSPDFESRVRSRGEAYLRQGRVMIDSADAGGVEAVVEGRGDDYGVYVDWGDSSAGIISAGCSCPYFDGWGFCKHLWATLRAIEESKLAPGWVLQQRLELVAGEPAPAPVGAEEDLFAGHDVGEGAWDFPRINRSGLQGPARPLPPGIRRRASGSSGGPKWQGQLDQVAELVRARFEAGNGSSALPGNEREAWYVLDVGASTSHGGPLIHLFQRETKRSGEFGKIKRLSLDPDHIAQFTNEADRALLPRLLANRDPRLDFSPYYLPHTYGYADRVSELLLAPHACEFLIPELCRTGRFVWQLSAGQSVEEAGEPIAWDDGPRWRFRLRVDSHGKKNKKKWRITGELARSGEEVRPLDDPVLLLSQGLVLFEDRIARLDDGGNFGWIAVLRRDNAVEVPEKQTSRLIEHLWQAPEPPELRAPETLRWPEVPVEPHGRLRLRTSNHSIYGSNKLLATITFDYEGHSLRPDDPAGGVVDAEQQRVLLRNREREEELLAGLRGTDLQRPSQSYLAPEADYVLPAKKLEQCVDALVPAGWMVEADGRSIRRPGAFRLNVTSDVDWFDLEGEFDFEGTTARMPELLAAARNGSRYVTLDDGSQGLLPEEWLARYGALAELGDEQDDRVRFRPSQAALLDAMLAAQEQHVSVDRRFAAMRKKLRSFDGVKPRDETKAFQGRLREYQREGLGWLHFLQDFGFGGCLADDMGLGKTVQVLALLQKRRRARRRSNREPAPSLAVVPKSLVFNWIEEASRFTPKLRVGNYTGQNRKELLERPGDYDLLVTTYGTLRRDIPELKDIRFDYAILDEAQAIKNANSQAAKAARLIDADYRLAMTGTPVENHLGELWSLFEFLNPGMLGRSRAFQQVAKRTGQNGRDALPFVSRAVAPFLLRRTKEQVLSELPEKTEQTLHCDLTTKQRKQYNELRDYYRAQLSKKIETKGLAQSKMHVLEALLRLRQAACHPGLLDKSRGSERSAKFDVLLEQLGEIVDEGHKALVFSQFTSLLTLLRNEVEQRGLAYEYLDGRTRKRERRIRRFQEDPECPLFLISLKAGGHGLNLTAADYVYILDPWWNPAVEAQAVDRAHRIGQTSRVNAYRIIARNTVEEKILQLQQQKRELAESIVSADDSIIRKLTAEDLQLLLS